MKRAFALVVLLPSGGVLPLHAQSFSSRNDHSLAQQPELSYKVLPVDSGYLVVEEAFEPFSNAIRVCLSHVSQDGIITEFNSFGLDSIGCFSGNANGPSRSADGGLVICGGRYDGSRDGALFWRFNSAFDSIWSTELFPNTADNAIGRSARAHNGKFYGAGGIWHPGNQGQMFLAALDTNGALLWTHEYGSAVRDEAYSLDTVADGGLIIGGQHRLSSTNYDGYIVKTDPSGAEQWHQYLGGPYEDGWANVISTRAGQFVSVGSYATYQQGFTTKSKLYAAKLDTDGSVLWERKYGGQSEINGFSSVTELNDGSFIAPGSCDDTFMGKGVLVHFAPDGDSLWMRIYQHPPLVGVFSTHWLEHAIEDPDGSIVATGTCNDGQQDLWVIRVDSFGCLVPGCQLFDQVAEAGEELHVGLYPNPVHDRLYVSFRSGKAPNGNFELLDMGGHVVRRFAPGSKSEEVDLDMRPHPAGVYLLCYSEASGVRWQQRVVKE